MILKQRNYAQQRSPTLTTLLMVEECLKNQEGVISIGELKRSLPKQIMHQTLMVILDYLEYSGKIVFHDNGILWTYTPQSRLKKLKGLTVK